MTDSIMRSSAMLGTVVSIRVNLPDTSASARAAAEVATAEGFQWFAAVEAACSRFAAESELAAVSRVVGEPVQVSELLFGLLQFAVGVAERTGGAFDPTVGGEMIARGATRNFRSGAMYAPKASFDGGATYRDVVLSEGARTVMLRRPLMLDLGAVAKGMAIDLAANALRSFESFHIDAGGDIAVGSCNAAGTPWTVGIRNPHSPGTLIATVHLSNTAVCTSATYERGDHLVRPRIGIEPRPQDTLASATVVAPSAMVADALSTAAFVLGATDGIALLTREGVHGLLVRDDLHVVSTTGFPGSPA